MDDDNVLSVYIIQRKRRNRINSMSANHLHIPASLFLLLSVGAVPAAAVDIRGRGWQVAWTTTALYRLSTLFNENEETGSIVCLQITYIYLLLYFCC
mmetsp:Transcript_29475/g.33888  ORF Transcript_29475/g.33888 Transcript_29475/m.33888 type:complete len:97 (-) Transcript_29475:75-365(-)